MSQSRVLLESDTLHIGFHGSGKAPYPEDIVPGGVLRALAQHLRIDLKTDGVFWGDYCFFAAVTGEAFRFLQFMGLGDPQPGRPLVEQYGYLSIVQMYQHAFDAAGLCADLRLKPNLPDKATLQARIVQSLRDRQTPVISLGVFGPPEPFLITGFDQDGEVLLGWSHFQAEKKNDPNLSFEPTGQFRLTNWYDAIDGALIVTGTKPRPDLRDVYRSAIERGIRELRTTQSRIGGGALGTAAMEKWAAHLENDADFAHFSDEQWRKAHSDHGTTAGDLAERRALAGSFASLAARFLPEAAHDLHIAETAFQGAHDTIYEIWETVAKTGPFDPDLDKFKDPARRRTMAALVRRLIAFDRRATAALQRALNLATNQDPGPAIAPDPVLDGTVILTKAPAAASDQPPLWAPENIHLPNAMGMLRAFLDEPFGALNDAEQACRKLDYVLWMGFSGAAFGLLFDGPERANLPLVFDTLGYDYELWLSQRLATETGLPCRIWWWDDNLRRRIFWNLRDRRLPVLLFDCGQWPNWYLITQAQHWFAFQGYGGSSGEGYRPNEPLDHPKNPLRQIELCDWMKGHDTWTINITAKRRTPRPPLEDLYRRAIEWGATKMRDPKMKLPTRDGGEQLSTRPYHDWAQMMRTDSLFPADRPDILKQRRQQLEGHEVELAERRFYGAAFLDLASIRLSRPQLKDAAAHFRAIHKLMERIWSHLGGMEAADAHLKYTDKSVREAIAALLLDIEREETAAAALLSQ